MSTVDFTALPSSTYFTGANGLHVSGGSISTTRGLMVGTATDRTNLGEQRMQQAPLAWKSRMPRRVSKNTWYFVEDNTIPDFQLHLQKFRGKGHGEVRCSSPTRRLLDGSPEAQRLMIGHYGQAEAEMPNAVLVDVGNYATPELRGLRRMMDPNVQLREAVAETLAELVKASTSSRELSEDQQAELVAKYARIRDRFAQLRAEFAEMEAELDLMQLKLVDVLGEVE